MRATNEAKAVAKKNGLRLNEDMYGLYRLQYSNRRVRQHVEGRLGVRVRIHHAKQKICLQKYCSLYTYIRESHKRPSPEKAPTAI